MEKTIADIAQEQMDAHREASLRLEKTLSVFEPLQMPPGRYRIVNDRDLEHATQHGSRIVRVLERHTMHKAEVFENGTRNGYTNHERVEKCEWGPGQVFLIFTPVSAEEREQELQRAYDQSNEARRRADEAEQKRVAEVAELTKKILAAESRERGTQSGLAEATSRVLAAEERARKMETDLAKVRREIGEAAWKKILAEGA